MTGSWRHVTAAYIARAVITGFALLSTSGCGGGSPPDELQHPGVRHQGLAVTKSVLLESERLGLVADLATCTGRTIAAGKSLCVRDGTRVSCTAIDDFIAERIISSTEARECDYVVIGHRQSVRQLVAIRADGAAMWSRPYRMRLPTKGTVVDETGDAHVLFGDEASGLMLLEAHSGRARALRVTAAECTAGDFAGDARSELVCLEKKPGGTHAYTVRALNGEPSAQLHPNGYDFHTTRTLHEYAQVAVFDGESSIRLYGPNLHEAAHLAIPATNFFVHLQSIAKIPRTNGDPVYASVFGGRGGWNRAILLIHDADGDLLFHEVLDRSAAVIEPSKDGFLLGSRNVVYAYRLGPVLAAAAGAV